MVITAFKVITFSMVFADYHRNSIESIGKTTEHTREYLSAFNFKMIDTENQISLILCHPFWCSGDIICLIYYQGFILFFLFDELKPI